MKNLFFTIAIAITFLSAVSSCEKKVTVSNAEVNAELDRRVDYFVGVFGSKEKVEEYYGKSIAQLKIDFHDQIEKELLQEKMKHKN